MTPENQIVPATPPRVSILARIIPALSYALPALGAALSAFLFIGVMRAMRNAESAGIAAIAGGLSEANLAILISLYLAIVVGLVGIVISVVRMITRTTTASPSGWFFLVTGVFGFAPMFALWQAQSFLLEVIFASRPGGVVEVARQIAFLLVLSMCTGAVAVLFLLASSVVPLPRILRAKRKWAPVAMLVIMELVVIAMTVGYHLRTAWLYAQYQLRG
jgi:hypothetical protein